ncbi:MAG: hypothetical protein RR797_01295, partial [Christensenella sp.]
MIKKLIEKLESKLSYELLGALMDVCISEERHDVNKGCVRRLAAKGSRDTGKSVKARGKYLEIYKKSLL